MFLVEQILQLYQTDMKRILIDKAGILVQILLYIYISSRITFLMKHII